MGSNHRAASPSERLDTMRPRENETVNSVQPHGELLALKERVKPLASDDVGSHQESDKQVITKEDKVQATGPKSAISHILMKSQSKSPKHQLPEESDNREHVILQRIQELKSDRERILTDYKILYKDNLSLKAKLQMDDPMNQETYKKISRDWETLKETEGAYSEQIARLEENLEDQIKSNDYLATENKEMKKKITKLNKKCSEDLERSKEIESLKQQLNDIKVEDKSVKKQIKWLVDLKADLQQEVETLKKQISVLYKTIEGLENDIEYQMMLNRR